MKKITLLLILFFYSFFAFSQTPCSNLSTLDCDQVEVTLPVNLNFDGNQGGILSTGFTMVDPPSTILTGDDDINDDDVPGLVAQNISLSSGVLNVTATKGINYSQLSGTPNSTFTNSQMNALGVGFEASSNVIDIAAVIDQPNFTGSLNGGDNGSQQAGIWFGLNENNFVKLVVVKANTTQQKIQFALEHTDPNNAANLIITELNTGNFNTSGVSQINFRISIDPSDNSVRGFYSLDGGSEIQVGQSGTDFLTAPTTFLNGTDHDNNIGSNNLIFAGIMTTTRRATGGSMVISYDSFSVTEAITPFQAQINFQNNPTFTTPPAGYLADYGKGFGNSSVIIGSDSYEYGWKLASDGTTPIDISNEASNNGGSGALGGAGRNRIATTYSGASDQEKLEGTLIHFQGDNIMSNTGGTQSWAGQPRGNEVIWELEIPNGTYAVTIGLGDKDVNNLDSRHSATIEGYTIIPAFVPNAGQTVVETMIVEVTDGFLTMNGVGGFNSKITHIDVIESTGTPVNGVLGFSPNSISKSIEAGAVGTFSSTLSGAGATNIGLIINDNINAVDKNITGSNDWLTIPASNTVGLFDFAIDATNLEVGDTRNNKIIATAKGFIPAELDADLTATAVTVSEITTPFRMNVFGSDYTKDTDLYIAETPGYLVETQPTQTSNTGYTPYTVPGGHTELYYPRRFGPEFSYDFPIANGSYTVALHMVENFQTTSGARVFDVSIEGNNVIDDLDLFASYGKGALAQLSFDVQVLDGELNIDFLASINNAIVQAIEIVPVPQSNENDILTFALAEQTGDATIDAGNHSVAIEVNNGTDITDLVPTITISDNATISPDSGVSNDFTNQVNYTVTAEDGTTQSWSVNVTEMAPANTAPQITTATTIEVAENQTAAIDVDATDDNDSEGSGLTFTLSGGNDDGQFDIDASSGVVTFVIAPDFEVPADSNTDNVYDIQVTVTDSGSLSITQDIAITVVDELETPTNEFSYIENFTYTPGDLKSVSGGAWNPEVNNTSGVEQPDAPVVAEGLTSGTTHSVNIENLITTIDYATLINNPADLVANVPFYFGTYFKFSEIGTGNTNRVRVAIRVDDDAPGDQWIRQIIGRYDGNIKARLGLDGPNSNAGEQVLNEDQLIQFLVRGVWDGTGTITYQYTFSPTLTEGDNLWVPGTTQHSTSGTPKLGRIFIGSTSLNNTGKIGPVRLSTEYSEVVTELMNNVPIASFTTSISDLTVDLDASSSQDDGSITAYNWDFGNGDTANGETVSYDYPVAGTYTISLTVTDDQGLISPAATQEVTVESPLVVTSFPYGVNFQDAATTPPTGYVKDYGLPYGANEGGLTYGWIKLSDGQPIDLTTPSNGVGRNRGSYPGLDLSQQTLVHMQGNDVGSWTGNRANEGVWEIEVPNGWYEVSVSVGDPNQDGNLSETPDHFLSVEGITAIDIYDVDSNLPNGDPGRFSSGTVVVQVLDGKLTIDADNPLANNTKINSAVISETTDPRSTETDILSFVLVEDTAIALIDSENHTVTLEVANGTGLTLTPTITLSDGATISPLSGISQDFSTAINYTVTAEDETTFQVWEVTITEASPANETPVVDNQAFTVAEDAAINTIVGQVIATDDGTLVYSITAGNESGAFGIDETTGEITVLTSLDFETTSQYLLTVEVSDGELTDDAIVTIDISDVIEIEPCSPLSTLPCDQLAVSTESFSLDFTTTNGNLSESGFTMVLQPSARLVTDDDAVTDKAIPGYAPGLISQDVTGLSITSTKGIFFSQPQNIGRTPNSANTNSQINAMGVGMNPPTANFNVSSTLIIPDFSASAGNGSQQAGIWYGLDEDRYVKLVVSKTTSTTQRVQLQVENLTNNPGIIEEVNMDGLIFTPGDAIQLRLEFDITNNTVQGFYTLGTNAEVLVTNGTADALSVPSIYYTGIPYDTAAPSNLLSFTGIFTTHRNAAVDQSIAFLFKDFAIEEISSPLLTGKDILTFVLAEQTATPVAIDMDNQTVSIEVENGSDFTALSPIITISDGATIDPAAGPNTDLDDGSAIYTVTAEDGSEKEWTVTLTEAGLPLNETPVITANQAFSVAEDAAASTIVGTVEATDTDSANLTYAITAGNDDTIFAIDENTGEITTLELLDFETVTQYTLTVEVSDEVNTASGQITVDVIDVIEGLPCNPFSTLPCDQIVTTLPLNMAFDGSEGGLTDANGTAIGFTMADSHSGNRLPEDMPISYADVIGYEPSKLNIVNSNLVLTASKGIAYVDNNAQVNTLGVGLQNISTPLTIETKLLGIATGGGSAQAGIWFGLDDENFVKLNVNGDNVEMRREIGGVSINGGTSPDQIQFSNTGVSGNDVTLRLVVDPVASTITAYYAIDNGAFVQLTKTNFNNLVLPQTYLDGKQLNIENGSASFAGIYTTYRNGASFDTAFDYFSVSEENNPPVIDDQNFAVAEDAALNSVVGTVVATDEGSLTYAITAGNEGGAFAIDGSNGEITLLTALDYDTTPQYVLTIEVSDGTNNVSANITIDVNDGVEVLPCSPLSTLPCDQIETALPLSLDFTSDNGNLSQSGMTMVLEPSERLPEDVEIADPNVLGYAPSLISQSNLGLALTSTKGIFYSQLASQGTPSSTNTNSQMNALGVGITTPTTTFSISSTLENPDFSGSTGNGAQQAGIWFGLDEDHYIKLALIKTGTGSTKKVQLQVENMDQNTTQTAFLELDTPNIASNTGEITLRMELDPVNNTVRGYYTLEGGSEILITEEGVDFFPVPANYFTGTSYDTANPSDALNFAGIFTTHRNAAVDQSITVLFKAFEIDAEQPALALTFDTPVINFSGAVGENIAPQTVTVTANSGNPTITLSDDPDAGGWLVLPTDPQLGTLELGIVPNLPVGNYSTTLFAVDQPDMGYSNAEMTINLEITEPINNFAINVNFSDAVSLAPTGYEKDAGDAYADRGNGYSYGWLDANTSASADLTKNGRNRDITGVSDLNNTLIHLQYGNVSANAANGYLPDAKWEIEVPNGSYLVTVFVGDPTVDNPAANIPAHRINAEGVNLVDNYIPTGAIGSSTRFTSGSATVNVTDGRLTIDPLNGGHNTKINSIQIVSTTTAIQTPRVAGVTPSDGAINVSVTPTISANELFLPNFDNEGNAGVDNTTITTTTVKLFKQGNTTPIGASVNGTGGGDAINLAPNQPLEANTTYVLVIDGVLDLVGEPFEFFTSSFTTGSGNTGPVTDLDNVAFTNAGAVANNGGANGAGYSTLTIGPDGKLYGLVINGDIHRWSINTDGTLANKEILNTWKSAAQGNYSSRTTVGLTFDPAATANNLIAYITHDSGGLNNAPAWDGNLSRLTGANLEVHDLILTNLPRSKKDHLTNSMDFKDGEPRVIYFNQGSNSAAGAPDNAWGNRKERLLSGAALRLDLDKLPESQWPLNVKTTMDPVAINNVNVNSPTLTSTVATYTEDGQTFADDGTYNPFYVNAPLTLFATGIRNAYDLVWHSNGQLYIPTNGTAGGSNAPASINGTRRPDGTFYDHSNPLYPVIPSSNGNNVQRDWLFRVDPNSSLGFYGHPNPLLGQFVLNRGDADVNNSAYNGVEADINYRGAAFDFEFNKSPNGVIEYRSNAENGNLQGALLVVRYSGSSDIIALVPDGPNGDILTYKAGIPGFTGFTDPLDLVEDVSNGNIYVSDYARNEIVLLKPSNQAAPTPLIVLNTEEVTGDAIANSGTFTQEVLFSNLGNATLTNIQAELTGANAGEFTVVGMPSSINSQNSASFDVLFTPTSNGPKFAQLTITGSDAEPVVISLNGLGKTGTGGNNEPSLQWILDTHLGAGTVNVGDTNTATNLIDLPNGSTYNDILGDEVAVQEFERAIDAPVTLEVLSVYGPTTTNPVVGFGWYSSGNAASTNELFTVTNSPTSNGQTLNAPVTGVTEFDPGVESFGFYSRWPFFQNRQLFSEDALNTFTGAIPHHVRVYELPGESNAYIIATEEHISGFDYQDIVVIARNIRPVGGTPVVACSPISTLDCSELEVALPFSLDLDGTEGGLANTGFTMVDNPSARIAEDGEVFNANVPGFEPGQINFLNGNLLIKANKGIAFSSNTSSTEVNSQINTLGVGIDADDYGNFSITTTIINPYTDSTNNSEQAGIWFGLNEDNFVKLIANGASQIELRSEVNAVSNNVDQVIEVVPNLNTSTVQLRLYVDIDNNELVAFYSLNGGAELELGSLPLPNVYVNGNTAYDNLSFAGVFATKRREAAATEVVYTISDFAITPDNTTVAFEPININFSLPEDVPPTGYLVDSGLGFGDRGNTYSYGWLTTNGLTPLDLSQNVRNRNVTNVDILRNTLLHMQYGNVGGSTGVLTEGRWEIEVPNGNYNVTVGVGDPNIDGQEGTEPFHSINIEGINAIDRYSPTGAVGASTRFTSGSATVTVTDGRLTIDASGGFNTKINSLSITQDGTITQPFFANVTPANNSNNVAITDFQINVEVVTPVGYELDKATLAGNINLYEVTNAGEVLVPSNSNDTGGGDAITLTPLSSLKTFTTYTFRLTSNIEANVVGDINDRLPFMPFESQFTTGDEDVVVNLDLTGVEFFKVEGGPLLGEGTTNQRFSSLVIGPDGKLYASTIGNFNSDGKIYRWDMATDGTLENLEILSPELQGAAHPVSGPRNNNDRLIIGLVFDPASTADNLIAYVTHSAASITDGPEWDGILSKLTGPTLSNVEDLIIHLPRSGKDHLTNSIVFDPQGNLYINQGSNSAGGEPDPNWVNRPERLLSAAVLKVDFNKMPSTLPLSAFTTDNIGIINSASSASLTMSDGSYNPYATNSPLTIYATGIRNAYDLVWHSNGWLYIPTNGTAGNNNNSPNSPSTANYDLARRIDGLTTIPFAPALNGGETQKDWLFKTQGGSYHGHPNPYRGEFVLNHGGAPYSGLPGQEETSYTDVAKYPDNLGPDPNYREPAYDFGKNKSPNGAIEYQSNAFGGKLKGLLMVVRFSGQDDLLVMQPKPNGDIANTNGDVTGLGGFDDPLDVVEDPRTGNMYISEYDRDNNGTPKLTLLRATVPAVLGPEIAATPDELIFEMTVNNEGSNTDTKVVTITNDGNAVLNISSASITGAYADQFENVVPSGAISLNPGENQDYTVTFAPDLNGSNLGYQQASLTIVSNDAVNPTFEVGLHGLKKAGFEGGQEPALQDVVDALGIGINVGWTSLSSSTNPDPVGDEVEVELWVKAGDGPVNVTPVGRYSPQEELPFGWYTNNGSVTHHEVGILASGLANAQTLFPPVGSGDSSFDPEGAVFGFYVESETFGRFNYTEDAINTGIAHRTRIYPMTDREGNPIENSYLITFEDATNGDYQDYMFIIDNVFPFEDGTLVLNFDEQNIDFVASRNQEDVPVQQLTLFGNGGVTAGQINLTASEDWVVLPTDFELNSPFDLGIDATGLALGTYEATITATAPNYLDAVINVSLRITNELVYTYQFNFQDPDDIETSPVGYVDDIGMPYGTQSTSLGDMTFGWVDPGTFIPADASVNARNRNNGTNDNALLKTFTIIGHSSPNSYPQLDWVVNVPNGTYSVNISVGDPDYSDSNHVLDANGVTIVDYNQENDAPDDYSNFEETKLVDVIDGTLRLSLGTGGANAKPNYIRLAPFDSSLIPPTIVANFDGNNSATNTYRGSVQVSLEAIDESNSGGIARLEYVLDGNATAIYTDPLDITTEGAHTLIVSAEDNNGNTSEKTFNFTIETPTGALLAIENMTKVPGTDRGFPADDYYTFHRLGSLGQALVHDANVMRLNNTGTGDLVVTAINLSDSNDYTFELLDATGTSASLPINIAAGSYADLDITFIGTTGTGSNGIFVESIEIVSNADNALENKATLHGAYSPQPEGGDEINAQEVFDAFGFQTSMLSIVNDEGTIVPPNTKTTNPSSNYPVAANIDAGYEGDMILSSNFVQADPSKPVIGIQLSALHGGPSSNGAQFVAVGGTNTVGGINFSHNASYYQTLLPKNNGGAISFDTSNNISGAFRIAVSGYLTSGGNNINGNRPDLLGARVYKVIDHNGNVIPNEYIVLQDFVQGGCGAGSANCDWNDNTFYFINIRPEGVPSAQPIDDLLVNVDELFNVDVNQYFDNGYPGNTLDFTATSNGSALPSWMSYNSITGVLQGTAPLGTTGSFSILLEAEDANGLTASTTLIVNINEPPVAVDDEAATQKNLAINLDQLLTNDSEPNGEDILIVSVDTPQNGTAELNSEGTEVLYTPNNDYFGPDSFTYTIEDESGLTATANVLITVNEENQAPLAIISTNINEGPAALVVAFDGSGSTDDKNDIVGYLWDFGDGSANSNDMIAEHTYTSAGVYTASLSVTDSEGLFNTATVTITVSTPPNTNPVAVATATRGSSALQFNFNGAGSNDAEGDLTYSWDFGDGTPVATGVSPTHTYVVSGIYTVRLTVTDEGALTDSTTITVDTQEPVIGDFTLRINAGGPEVSHDGNVFSADQNFVGGKTYTNTSATVPALYQTERSASPPTFGYEIPLANGEYRVTLHFAEIFFGANGGGTLGTAQRIFDVVMEGNTILDDFDINAAVGPQTVTTRTFDVVVEDGILNLGFDATAPDGVNQPKLSAIEIFGLAEPNIAPTAVATASPLTGTAPLEVSFDGSGSSDDKGIDSYLWNFDNDQATSSTETATYTFDTAGVYSVTLTVTDAEGESDTETIEINVTEPINTDPIAVASADVLNGIAPMEVNFDGSGSSDTEGNLSYLWDFGDGTPISNVVSPTHTFATNGVYTVTLTVTDEGQLTDSATLTITVDNPITGDFVLRINAGGPELSHDGNVFSADQNFVGGKTYTNTSATVPALYQTERSASPPTFGYEIPLANGEYRVTLHFAEIYFGANGGGTLGTAQRIFDVVMEGSTILDDFDINAAVGPQTITTRTFDVVVEDGILNLGFDATAPDGVNQPKLSAIEIFGLAEPNIAPTAVATAS
ncbi:malectin domain-containing carbohydrate-binding protein, partial [Arenibacter echinorum]